MTWTRNFAVCLILAISPWVKADTPIFEIGKLSFDPLKQIPQIEPMADYLAHQMQIFGYESGKATVFANMETAKQALSNGSLDILTASLYEAVQLIRGGEAEPLAVKWKNGLPQYSSIIIVHTDSDIYELGDLLGKTIAFKDSSSTNAYFFPYMALRQADFQLNHVESVADNKVEAINYRFSGAEKNSAALLFQNKVEAIAMSDYDWLRPNHIQITQKEEYRIIWMSEPYPAGIEVINSKIPVEQRDLLRDKLIQLHLTAEGHELLGDYYNSSRFSRVSDEVRGQLDVFADFLSAEQLSFNQ